MHADFLRIAGNTREQNLSEKIKEQVIQPLDFSLASYRSVLEYMSEILREYNEAFPIFLMKEEKRFTREDLAARIHLSENENLSYNMIRRYFSTGVFPSRDLLLAVCAALHMDCEQCSRALDMAGFSRLNPALRGRDLIIRDYLQKYRFSGDNEIRILY